MKPKYATFEYPNQVTDFIEKLKIEAASKGLDPKIIGITGEIGSFVVFYWEP